MKKSTKILALCFSAAAIAAAAGVIYLSTKDTGKKIACIYENGNLIHRIDLTAVRNPYTIELDGNIIFVEHGQISVIEADCPDKLCIKQGAISNGARPIVCLPNNVVIKLTDEENDVDITQGV